MYIHVLAHTHICTLHARRGGRHRLFESRCSNSDWVHSSEWFSVTNGEIGSCATCASATVDAILRESDEAFDLAVGVGRTSLFFPLSFLLPCTKPIYAWFQVLVLISPKERAQFRNRRLRKSASSRIVLDSEILARRDSAPSILVNRREQWYEFYDATCCIILTTTLGSCCVECCRETAVLKTE